MNLVALMVTLLALPVGMWLRQGRRSSGLWSVIIGLAILGGANLVWGASLSALFYAASAVVLLLGGWAIGAPRVSPKETP